MSVPHPGMGPPSASPPGASDNRGPLVLGLVWILRPAAVVVVCLRLLTRIKFKKTAGWDDACIAVSAVLTTFGMIWNTIQVHYHFGRHIYTMNAAQLAGNAKYLLFAELFNFADLFFMRTSVCFFTWRLLPPTQRWWLWLIIAAFIFNFISTLANMVTFSVQCRPIQGLWNPSIPAHCFDLQTLDRLFYMGTIFGVIADFIIVAVPMTIIRHVQMTRSIKIGTYIIISLSLITAGLSIGKCVVVKDIHDPYYDSIDIQLFSLFEENLGIIFASVPALRQFHLHLHNRLRSDGASRPSGYLNDLSKHEEGGGGGGPPRPPSPKSNHSSGIFGKAQKYSIVRRNFETHRKLHDIAGHFSVATDSLDRVATNRSRDSNQTGHFTTMESIAELPSPDADFRKDSTATLVNDKLFERPEKSRSPAPTGRRKEGQSASPRIPTVSYESLPIDNKEPRIEQDDVSPISPVTPEESRFDRSRSTMNPNSSRHHAASPAALRVTPIPFATPFPSRNQSSHDITKFPIPTEPSTRKGSPPPSNEAHIATMHKHRRRMSREAPAVVQSTNQYENLRSRFSLHKMLRISRSADNLGNRRKRANSVASNTSRTSHHSIGHSTAATSSTWKRPDTLFLEEHNDPLTTEAYHSLLGVRKEDELMLPSDRPSRSPMWIFPPPSASIMEHPAYKSSCESLSPAVERVSNVLQHPLLRGSREALGGGRSREALNDARDASPIEEPRLSEHPAMRPALRRVQSRDILRNDAPEPLNYPTLKTKWSRDPSPMAQPEPLQHTTWKARHDTPQEEKEEPTLYSRFSAASSVYPERPGKILPGRSASPVPQIPKVPSYFARKFVGS